MIRGFTSRAVLSALAAGLVIGCTSTTVIPSDGPGETSSSVASATPIATPRSFEPLPSRCPAPPVDGAIDLEVSLLGLRGYVGANMDLISATPVDGSGSTTEYGPPAGGWEGGLLKGGAQVELTIERIAPALLADASLSAVLLLADGRTLAIDVGQQALTLAIPDLNGTGSLDIRLTWNDDCYAYVAATGLDVTVVASAIVEACPTGDAFTAMMEGYNDSEVEIGGVQVPFFIDQRFERYGGDRLFGEGDVLGTFEAATPVATAPPGSLLTYAFVDAEFRLLDSRAEFYPRDAALRDAVGEPSFWAHRESANGARSMELAVPSEAGRYAVLARLAWHLPCAFGSAFAVVAVDVE